MAGLGEAELGCAVNQQGIEGRVLVVWGSHHRTQPSNDPPQSHCLPATHSLPEVFSVTLSFSRVVSGII